MIFLEMIVYPLVYILLVPILVFIHELAHSFIALFFSKEKVYLILGDGKINKNFNLGRLNFCFNGYKSILGIVVGYVKCDVEDGYKALLLYISGPLVSLIITVYLYIVLKYNSQNMIFIIQVILNSLFNYSLAQFLSSAIPLKYHFMPHKNACSDGYNIMMQLKKCTHE